MIRNLACAAAIAAALLLGMQAVVADTTPAPAPPAAGASNPKPADTLSRVLGPINAVDTKAKTVTLGSFGGGDQTIAYNDDTRFMLDIPAAISDIKVGDTLRGITLGGGDPGGNSISPNFLNIVPPVDVNGPPFTGPIIPTEGVVATLTPLTITTADKKTITVNITPDTRLSKSKNATAADAKPGMFGSAIVKGAGAGEVLTELHIIQPPDNN